MWWVAVVVGALVATVIMREPYMRSARVAGVVAGCTLAGSMILNAAPPWTLGDLGELAINLMVGIVGIGVVAAPLLICSRWGARLSALPPDDYREHERIVAIRRLLAHGATAERRSQAMTLLESVPAPADEWLPVRAALVRQIGQSEDLRSDHPDTTMHGALTARRELMTLWRSALERRSRFFR
jgi:hypothetical protein